MKRTIENNKDFIEMLESVRSFKAVFEDEITMIERKYKKELERISKDYRPGSDGEKSAKAKAQEEREGAREKVVSDCRKAVEDQILKLRIRADAEIRTVSDSQIQKLIPLMNLNLSRYEVEQLVASYGGNYWADKILLAIAEKNEIAGGLELNPPIEDRIAVLDRIETDFNKILDTFPGYDDASISDRMLLADSVCLKLERKYTNGNTKLSSAQQADRAVTEILSAPDMMHRGLKFAEKMRKSDEQTQKFILAKLQDRGNSADLESILSYASMDARKGLDLETFSKGEKTLMDDARKTIEKVLDSSVDNSNSIVSMDEIKTGVLLWKAEKNPYFEGELAEKARLNSDAKAIYDTWAKTKLKDERAGNTTETDFLISQAQGYISTGIKTGAIGANGEL